MAVDKVVLDSPRFKVRHYTYEGAPLLCIHMEAIHDFPYNKLFEDHAA